MFNKMTVLAAILSVGAAGHALAQESAAPAAGIDAAASQGNYPHQVASEEERAFYDERGPILGGFFMDETMAELRPEADIQESFAALDADEQAAIRADCDRVEETRGSFGTTSRTLCSQIGEL